MNIPGFFGGNAVGGSTVSGFLGLVVDEALTANALCDPDNSRCLPSSQNSIANPDITPVLG
jgi:hypothetical protein